MRRHVITAGVVIGVACVAYLLLWPVPIQPIAWQPPEVAPLTGPFASNARLREAEPMQELGAAGPEDIGFAANGELATGLEDGNIVLFDPATGTRSVLVNTGGRPFGMVFDSAGRLVVADADRGLLRVSRDGTVEELVPRGEGVEFADDLDIGSDGTIYFSDASSRYDRHQVIDELLQHEPYGRLLAFEPESRELRILLDGLYFANGVALAADESYVLVCESAASRIRRYWLTGERRGEEEVFVANLPGYPDNINRGTTATYWLSIPQPRFQLVDRLSGSPLLTRVLYRVPFLLAFAEVRHPIVLGLDEQGAVTQNLQDNTGHYCCVTSVMERGGALWIGNLAGTAPLRLTMARTGI